MFGAEIRKLLAEVLTSWQVIAVTVILVLYIFLINYVTRLHYRRPPYLRPAPRPAASEPEPSGEDDVLDTEEDEAAEPAGEDTKSVFGKGGGRRP